MKPIEENVIYEQSAFRTLHPKVDRFDFNWHFHEEYEVSLILKGTGLRYTGDTIDHFSGPELVFIPPNVPHSWQSDDIEKNKEAIILQFRSDFFGQPLEQMPDASYLKALFEETRAQKIEVSDKIIELTKLVHQTVGLDRLLNFFELMRKLRDADKTFANDITPVSCDEDSQQKFNKVSKYIHDNWNEQIALIDLANLCGMSQSSFQRFFKRATGRSFVDYLNTVKISKACELLINGDKSILEICFIAGFRNLSFFNRKFKQNKGISPKKFRKLHQV